MLLLVSFTPVQQLYQISKPPCPCVHHFRRFVIVPDEEFLVHKAAHAKACHCPPFTLYSPYVMFVKLRAQQYIFYHCRQQPQRRAQQLSQQHQKSACSAFLFVVVLHYYYKHICYHFSDIMICPSPRPVFF